MNQSFDEVDDEKTRTEGQFRERVATVLRILAHVLADDLAPMS